MDLKVYQLKSILDEMEIIDLSQTLENDIPAVPSHARFFHNLVHSYKYGHRSCHYQLVMSEHSGTHVDSPLHFIAEGPYHYGMDAVPLTTFTGRAIRVSATEIGENGLFTKQHMVEWEKEYGPLEEGDIVLIRFGWDQFWKKRPDDQQFMKNWPGVAQDAAKYFVDKKVKMVGTDAIAIDVFESKENPAHHTLLGNGVLIMENLNNLDRLPTYSYFMGFPLKIKDGSGSPIRAVAFVSKE